MDEYTHLNNLYNDDNDILEFQTKIKLQEFRIAAKVEFEFKLLLPNIASIYGI